MNKIKIYKENDDWFVDDDNGFTKDENELVAGIPEIIEAIVGDKKKGIIQYSDVPFSGSSLMLNLLSTDKVGSTYSTIINDKQYDGWLCKVFFHYFKTPPEKLYVSILGE